MKEFKKLSKLKMLRKNNNLSQDELATMFGIHQQTYGLYELGKRELPPRLAKKIAKILKVNWWELYEE